jgi:hypothetical protein
MACIRLSQHTCINLSQRYRCFRMGKDEQKYGQYRTKQAILKCFDAMAEAMKTGRPYQTILDPPPADPRVAHPLNQKG